ncbi:MAG TPA: hypothetical protein VEU74_11985 [Gemmatimonadales bacterium]|nr:hypothetical protein [Gemmatimonadales bacterium]
MIFGRLAGLSTGRRWLAAADAELQRMLFGVHGVRCRQVRSLEELRQEFPAAYVSDSSLVDDSPGAALRVPSSGVR